MNQRLARLAAFLALVILSALPLRSALADAAPPPPIPGDTIHTTSDNTHVQMVSEDVLITITDDQAIVHASFQLRNQGTAPEAFDVWFPDGYYEDMSGTVRRSITDFSVAVDGAQAVVGTSYTYYTLTNCAGTCAPIPIPWRSWPVTFPAAQTVALSVDYALPATRYLSDSFDVYHYIVSTGAGWYGTIGHGRVTVRLPYDITPDNLDQNSQDYYTGLRPGYYAITGSDIVWTFDNLEPTSDDNISVTVMRPAYWRALQSAEAQVRSAPDSVEAHAALAKALVQALDIEPAHGNLDRSDRAHRMYDRALAESKRLVDMASDRPDYRLAYLKVLSGPLLNDQYCPEMLKAAAAFPNDPGILAQIRSDTDYCRVIPQMTSQAVRAVTTLTPGSAPTTTEGAKASDLLTARSPTLTAQPAPTLAPTPQSQSPDRPATGSAWPFIAAGAIVLAGFGVWWLARRTK